LAAKVAQLFGMGYQPAVATPQLAIGKSGFLIDLRPRQYTYERFLQTSEILSAIHYFSG
jgi:hypothetical protein